MPTYEGSDVYLACYLIGFGSAVAFAVLDALDLPGILTTALVVVITVGGFLGMLHLGAAHERGDLV